MLHNGVGMQIWDAIVVGAGPAGCAAAYDLAAAGRQVLLLDKASFPRPKACAGALTMKAVRALRYAITPVVRKSVAKAVLEGRSVPEASISVSCSKPFCVMTIRAELDAYCLEQTCARGAVFRQITAITAITRQQDSVLLQLSGEVDPLAARLLIGADGVHSRVRALSGEGAAWFRRGFAVEANVPFHATQREFPLTFDFAPMMAGYGWLFPRNDHVNVGLYTTGDTAEVSADRLAPSNVCPAESKASTVDRSALTRYILARCGTAEHHRITGQFLGLGAARYTPSATQVLLAGDAAGFVDPLTGEGIHGAIVSGQAAAAAALESLAKGGDAGAIYRDRLRSQRADLAVSERAAAFFYGQPERGFRLMRLPFAGRAVLHAYSEGKGLSVLARGLGVAHRLVAGRAQKEQRSEAGGTFT